jgi:hypothetical protein
MKQTVALTVLLGILSLIIIGCSTTQQTKQFIEVRVNKDMVTLNIDHIVSIQPNGDNGAVILMDTSNGMNGGHLNISESYDVIIKRLSKQ